MTDYRETDASKAFRNKLNRLIDEKEIGPSVGALLFAAKSREAIEVRYRMSQYDGVFSFEKLDGRRGETEDDINYIIEHAGERAKIGIIRHVTSPDNIDKFNPAVLRGLIRESSDTLSTLPYRVKNPSRDDINNDMCSISSPFSCRVSSMNLFSAIDQLFENDEDMHYLINKLLGSSEFGDYSRLMNYISLAEAIINSDQSLGLDALSKSWLRKESALSRNGKHLFTDNSHDPRAFTYVFKQLNKAYKKLSDIGADQSDIGKTIRSRIKSFVKLTLDQLDKGVNDSLIFFGDRNSSAKGNPIGDSILDFSRVIIENDFSIEFKSKMIGKILASVCNGNTKNIERAYCLDLLKIAEPIVSWENVIGSLNKKGKNFLIKNSQSPGLFEPYLDKSFRAILLIEGLSI